MKGVGKKRNEFEGDSSNNALTLFNHRDPRRLRGVEGSNGSAHFFVCSLSMRIRNLTTAWYTYTQFLQHEFLQLLRKNVNFLVRSSLIGLEFFKHCSDL